MLSLNPPSTLNFSLQKGVQSKSTLQITNTTGKRVVFKVKTTQPNWYYVKPNQQLLDLGQSEQVQIVVVVKESDKYLDQTAAGAEAERVDKHRFLVQSKVVEESDFLRIKDLPATKKQEELTKLWDINADDKTSTKLKVEFKLDAVAPSSPARAADANADEHSKSVRERLVRVQSESASASTSPEMMMQELQNLRKKYDGVVEYTVQITAERDSLLQQLEVTQKDLAKEKSKKKDVAAPQTKLLEKVDKKQVDKGFSLFIVLITALICFLIGKYIG